MSLSENSTDIDPTILSRFVIVNNGVTDFSITPSNGAPPITVAQINAIRPTMWIPHGSCEGGVDQPNCVYADDEAIRRSFFGEAELKED